MHQSNYIRRTTIAFGFAIAISLLAIFIQNTERKQTVLKQANTSMLQGVVNISQ